MRWKLYRVAEGSSENHDVSANHRNKSLCSKAGSVAVNASGLTRGKARQDFEGASDDQTPAKVIDAGRPR